MRMLAYIGGRHLRRCRILGVSVKYLGDRWHTLKRLSASFGGCLSDENVLGFVLGNNTHFLLKDSVLLRVVSLVEELAHQIELVFKA